MENTQTNDIYIKMLFCDGCGNHGNKWRQIGSDECDRLGEYLAVAGESDRSDLNDKSKK